MNKFRAWCLLSTVFCLLPGVWQADAAAQTGPDGGREAATKRCEGLARLDLERVADSPGAVVKAMLRTRMPASEADRAQFIRRGQSQGILTPALDTYPDHCLVDGYVTPHIHFNLMLPPPDQWNGRFLLAACEGWCGRVNEDTVVPGLNRGYATATNDGGHYGRVPFDGVWAHRNVQARIEFAHRANHVTAQIAKAVVEAYYGTAPKYSYITGFSKGGNAGLFTALKYPQDFDGVFAKAPVPYYQWKNAAHFPWVALAVYPDGKTPVMTAEKLPLLVRAVNAACDAIDGLEDGIIDDPRRCRFDPGVLLCKRGQPEAECLTAPQVESVRKVYAVPTDASGTPYYPFNTDLGTESGWTRSVYPLPGDAEDSYSLVAAKTGLRYMVFKDNPGPDYDWRQFDYVKEEPNIRDMAEILDPSGADLTAFKARGGKLIIVHGWADTEISARMTIDWFEKMQAHMGGAEATAEFAQLYVVPGMHHGTGGAGPYEYDAFTALERWVEAGTVPDQLMLRDDPRLPQKRTRPAFPYPDKAVYQGAGDPDDARSFRRQKGGWLLESP